MTAADESTGHCHVDADEAAPTIRLRNAGAANALTPTMLEEIRSALSEHGSQRTRVVFLAGSNGMFSSGYDTAGLKGDASRGRALLAEVMDLIEHHPVPVVAVIEGHCVGAGVELALACDFRLAASSASFLMPPGRLGIVYPAAGVKRLVQAIGAARTRYLLYTAERIDAEAALRMGLVETVVPDAELEVRVQALRQMFVAERAPLSMRGTKETVRVVAEELSAEAIRHQRRLDVLAREALESADHAEAMQARAERRSPRFTGE